MRITVDYKNNKEIISHIETIESFLQEISVSKSLEKMYIIFQNFISFIENNPTSQEKIENYLLSLEKELNNNSPLNPVNTKKSSIGSLSYLFKLTQKEDYKDAKKLNFSVAEHEIIFEINNICCGKVLKNLPAPYKASKCGDILEPIESLVQYESFPYNDHDIYKEMLKNLSNKISEDSDLVSRLKNLGFENIYEFICSSKIADQIVRGK